MIVPPSRMPIGASLFLMRSGMSATWEEFPSGGAWSLRLERDSCSESELDRLWESLVLAVIGEQLCLQRADEVVGCELSLRKTHAKLAVWTRSASDENVQRAIARRMRELLAIETEPLGYDAFVAKRRATRAAGKPRDGEPEPSLYEEPRDAATVVLS